MSKYEILLVGHGSGIHALGWKLSQSENVARLNFAPGNGGTNTLGTNLPMIIDNVEPVMNWLENNPASFTLVNAPEALAAGMVDALRQTEVPVFGPSRAITEMFTSRLASKKFMREHDIPTADFEVFNSITEAKRYSLSHPPMSYVIKLDGVKGGQQVWLPRTTNQVDNTLAAIQARPDYDPNVVSIMFEQRLVGEEVTEIILCDEDYWVEMPTVQVEKDFENIENQIINMGAYTRPPHLRQDLLRLSFDISNRVFRRALEGIWQTDAYYDGILSADIILTKDGPMVTRFTPYLRDLEAELLMPLLETDLTTVLEAITHQRLQGLKLNWRKGVGAALMMVPEKVSAEGSPIFQRQPIGKNIHLFHYATKLVEDVEKTWLCVGNRGLAFSAIDESLNHAIASIYDEIEARNIEFEGGYVLKDVGGHALSLSR